MSALKVVVFLQQCERNEREPWERPDVRRTVLHPVRSPCRWPSMSGPIAAWRTVVNMNTGKPHSGSLLDGLLTWGPTSSPLRFDRAVGAPLPLYSWHGS